METGVDYNKLRLHKVGYFADLLSRNEEVNESIRPLVRFSRARNSFEEPKAIS
jgi:transposase